MNIDKLKQEIDIDEVISNLVCRDWLYGELYSYYKKYEKDHQLVDLPFEYIFKYFRSPASQVNGTYVFLGLNLEKNKVIFGRIYKPKLGLWNKHILEVGLNKFKKTAYEISDKPIDRDIS